VRPSGFPNSGVLTQTLKAVPFNILKQPNDRTHLFGPGTLGRTWGTRRFPLNLLT
jgi:hypothetical protein